MESAAYKRVVIKLSGEALAGEHEGGIDPKQLDFIASTIRDIYKLGVQIGIVVGAGNLWRGNIGVAYGMDNVTADHMGMIATVINALGLRDALERAGIPARVQTAVQMNQVAEPYIRLRAIRHLEKGRVVIFAGGTGNPFFTTDSAAALRAREIKADVIIKATKVDGVYDTDPKKNPNAKKFERITYGEAIDYRVKVMDMTAITMCMDNGMPLIVLNFWEEGALRRAILGEKIGTYIGDQH
ncbi:MAG: UMP kinase [Phototrophicales bacterium]|nr:MAG: UMP kinase [Phototrophicales bacterium]